jgi:uncharacterized protein DUF5916/cellulose/xylan binding protein with CBM9 domain
VKLAPAALVVGAVLLPAAASAAPPVEGPPAPVPPAVMARDPQGRVTVRAVRVAEPPRIDGVLDEEAYRTIQPIADFIQQEPDEGRPATEPTEVWVLFDAENLYVSARCHDSHPEKIVANDMRRDGRNIGQNDNLSVMIDTFHDRRNGYEFLINSIGGLQDNQVTDERDVNRDWNTVWRLRSRRDDRGWTAELAIPFRSLRYRAGGDQVWGLNIRRTVRWKNEYSYLSPVPRTYGVRGILRLSSAATLVGLEPPAAALNLELKPYAVSSVRADRTADPTFSNELDGDAGFDLKYGFTRGLTADLTYRTDFAQVEDDDQQVNLTRFSVFFPEKREFFLEGQGIYAFGGVESAPRPGNPFAAASNTPFLFFSRQIGLVGGRPVPIRAGGRVTGKAGRYSLGLLDIQTGDSAVAAAPATNFAVARVKRDILRRSYVGVIATRRSPAVSGAGAGLAFGADANLSFFESLNLVGYYARTDTPGAAGRQDSYRARFDYDADRLAVQVERLAVGRNFSPEVGFLRRRDFIGNLAQVRLSRRPRSKRAVRKVSLEAGLDYITDGAGRLENRQARATARTEMQAGDSWSVQYERNFEFLPAPFPIARGIVVPVGGYHFPNLRAAYTLGPHRRVSGDLTLARGGFYAGDRTEAGYRGRVELSSRLFVEPGMTVNWVDLPQGRFTARLLSARATLTFSPAMWVGALVQYNSNASLVSTNVRFRWEYRPGSDVFVVYSDGRDPLGPGAPTVLLNRSLTFKVTRLFRF